MNDVFLHADLAGRPYPDVDFRDGSKVIDTTEMVSMGQFQVSHICDLNKHGSNGEIEEGGTPQSQGQNMFLDLCIVQRRQAETTHGFPDTWKTGVSPRPSSRTACKVRNVTKERWRVPGMESMGTLNREACHTLNDKVTAEDLPRIIKVFVIQSLLLVAGRFPLCLRCKKVGDIRRQVPYSEMRSTQSLWPPEQ